MLSISRENSLDFFFIMYKYHKGKYRLHSGGSIVFRSRGFCVALELSSVFGFPTHTMHDFEISKAENVALFLSVLRNELMPEAI